MKKKGFTFIEILVVVSIIAVLIAVGVISYGSIQKRSRDARRKSDIEQIRSALEFYRSDNGYYPDGPTTFTALSSSANPGKVLIDDEYIAQIPSDPKDDTEYAYQIKMLNLQGEHYYGYCLAAYTEGDGSGSNACTTETLPSSPTTEKDYTYGVKNP